MALELSAIPAIAIQSELAVDGREDGETGYDTTENLPLLGSPTF